MSGEGGGDTGGATKGGGSGDSGGFSGGGDTADYGGGGGFSNGGAYEPSGGWTSSNTGSSGFGGDTADYGSGGGSDFLSGGTGGGGGGGFSGGGDIADYGGGVTDVLGTGGGGSPDGLNLAGSGPVGGISQPVAAGGVYSSDSGPGAVSVGQDTNPLGTTATGTGGGTSAAAFAAPEGVSGTPQLSDWISNPAGTGTTAPAGPDQGIFDQLNAAQTGAANQYADTASLAVPSAPSATTPAAASSGTGSSATGGMSSASTVKDTGFGFNTNTLGIGAAAAGLLNNLINAPKTTPAVGALNQNAATANANSQNLIDKGLAQGEQYGKPALDSGQSQVAKGTALQEYVATGKLPEGYEAQIQEGVNSAKQTIISNYANRGLPTDPTRNSSLAQELSQVDARVPAMREQMAAQLATTGNSIVASGNATSSTGNQLTGNQLLTDGLQAAGISSSVYSTLANLENDKNKQQGQAIANFAAALNGGNKGLTLKVA